MSYTIPEPPSSDAISNINNLITKPDNAWYPQCLPSRLVDHMYQDVIQTYRTLMTPDEIELALQSQWRELEWWCRVIAAMMVGLKHYYCTGAVCILRVEWHLTRPPVLHLAYGQQTCRLTVGDWDELLRKNFGFTEYSVRGPLYWKTFKHFSGDTRRFPAIRHREGGQRAAKDFPIYVKEILQYISIYQTLVRCHGFSENTACAIVCNMDWRASVVIPKSYHVRTNCPQLQDWDRVLHEYIELKYK